MGKSEASKASEKRRRQRIKEEKRNGLAQGTLSGGLVPVGKGKKKGKMMQPQSQNFGRSVRRELDQGNVSAAYAHFAEAHRYFHSLPFNHLQRAMMLDEGTFHNLVGGLVKVGTVQAVGWLKTPRSNA